MLLVGENFQDRLWDGDLPVLLWEVKQGLPDVLGAEERGDISCVGMVDCSF